MYKQLFLLLIIAVLHCGCSVITVADAAVSTAATAVKTTVKVTGAVVDAVIPDRDDEDD